MANDGIDQIKFFLKLGTCQFMILGLDASESENEFLNGLSEEDLGRTKICLLNRPGSHDTEDTQPLSLNIPYTTASFKGLFVPKTLNASHKLSYVDIVKYTSPKRTAESGEAENTIGRKVSNASTVSTQADDELSNNTKDHDLKPVSRVSRTFFDENTSNPDPDFSELSCTLRQRKLRMDTRRKESQSKKHDNELLAIVQCPKEEPDRSISRFVDGADEKGC